MALEARGDIKYGNKGNMTKDEIDKTMKAMIGHQEVRPFPLVLVVVRSVGEPHGLGRGRHPVDVVAGRRRGARRAAFPAPISRSRKAIAAGATRSASMKHVSGLKLDCFYEYLNWYTGGFQGAFIARQGYYSAQPENAKKYLTQAEWDYWYDGKPAATEILNPFGKVMEQAGDVRDGGSIEQRLGNIAVWNSVMDEDRYLTRKWNEFISS